MLHSKYCGTNLPVPMSHSFPRQTRADQAGTQVLLTLSPYKFARQKERSYMSPPWCALDGACRRKTVPSDSVLSDESLQQHPKLLCYLVTVARHLYGRCITAAPPIQQYLLSRRNITPSLTVASCGLQSHHGIKSITA